MILHLKKLNDFETEEQLQKEANLNNSSFIHRKSG